MADAPFGARSRLLLLSRALRLRLVVLLEAVGRLRVDQIVFLAVNRPCSFSNAISLVASDAKQPLHEGLGVHSNLPSRDRMASGQATHQIKWGATPMRKSEN